MRDPPECHFFLIWKFGIWGEPCDVSPYSGGWELTVAQWDWNAAIGQVQISVEHGFGLIFQDWLYLNTFWKQRCGGQPVGYGIGRGSAHQCPFLSGAQPDCHPV